MTTTQHNVETSKMADILGELMNSQSPINFICHFHISEHINNVINNKQCDKK